MNTFDYVTLAFESSEPDTDTDGMGQAILEVGGDLIEDVDAEWNDTSDDDEYDSRPNAGQYTQKINITFTREVTLAELTTIMENVGALGQDFGFGNGWEIE